MDVSILTVLFPARFLALRRPSVTVSLVGLSWERGTEKSEAIGRDLRASSHGPHPLSPPECDKAPSSHTSFSVSDGKCNVLSSHTWQAAKLNCSRPSLDDDS